MLVLHMENQDASALVHALFLGLFYFGNVCFSLVGVRYQRNSFDYLMVGDNHKDTKFHVMIGDVDAANSYNRADRKVEGEVKYRNIIY